jgi:hypothetical protein
MTLNKTNRKKTAEAITKLLQIRNSINEVEYFKVNKYITDLDCFTMSLLNDLIVQTPKAEKEQEEYRNVVIGGLKTIKGEKYHYRLKRNERP